MQDRTGRELKKGQSVDILLNGMFTGVIIDIREVPIAVTKDRLAPPQLAIQLIVQHVPATGSNAGVYIVGEPSDETKTSGLIQQGMLGGS